MISISTIITFIKLIKICNLYLPIEFLIESLLNNIILNIRKFISTLNQFFMGKAY